GKFGKGPARSVANMPDVKRSMSAMVWFAHARSSGFDLTHHNVFFSGDYAREFREISGGRPPSDPTVYLCAQDRSARTGDATPLHDGRRERIQMIVNAPSNGDTQTYSAEEIERFTSGILATERAGPLPNFPRAKAAGSALQITVSAWITSP
ncbi:MAG: hypothetical protein AAFR32_09720, partial [Pseudomonadota bacterium]